MVTFGQNVGDIATYMCNDGFYLRGSMTRLCQNNGMWSHEAPMCLRKQTRNLISTFVKYGRQSHRDYHDFQIATVLMQGG